jgi:hypothetical protein
VLTWVSRRRAAALKNSSPRPLVSDKQKDSSSAKKMKGQTRKAAIKGNAHKNPQKKGPIEHSNEGIIDTLQASVDADNSQLPSLRKLKVAAIVFRKALQAANKELA